VVVWLLLEKGAHVNEKDGKASAALHLAAENGYETVAGLLVNKGADINAISCGSTPLYLAV
jgi:ankyrin repeat protein